jgi:protease-4
MRRQMLNQIHAQFIDVVKTGRGKRLKLDTPGLFSGLFWSGEQAVEYWAWPTNWAMSTSWPAR